VKQNFGVEHFIRGVREILGRATERLAGARGKFFFWGPYLKIFVQKNFFSENNLPPNTKKTGAQQKIFRGPQHLGARGNLLPLPPLSAALILGHPSPQ
jgi:hypothetical protein